MTETDILQYEPDDVNDEELCHLCMHVKDLCFLLNRYLSLVKKPHPYTQKRIEIPFPFYVDYGHLCQIGKDTFINHNAYFMDGGMSTIGVHCFIDPNCAIYTALHPLDKTRRNR